MKSSTAAAAGIDNKRIEPVGDVFSYVLCSENSKKVYFLASCISSKSSSLQRLLKTWGKYQFSYLYDLDMI